jgi:hypothetical protein
MLRELPSEELLYRSYRFVLSILIYFGCHLCDFGKNVDMQNCAFITWWECFGS